jgi:hypothetical protein
MTDMVATDPYPQTSLFMNSVYFLLTTAHAQVGAESAPNYTPVYIGYRECFHGKPANLCVLVHQHAIRFRWGGSHTQNLPHSARVGCDLARPEHSKEVIQHECHMDGKGTSRPSTITNHCDWLQAMDPNTLQNVLPPFPLDILWIRTKQHEISTWSFHLHFQ